MGLRYHRCPGLNLSLGCDSCSIICCCGEDVCLCIKRLCSGTTRNILIQLHFQLAQQTRSVSTQYHHPRLRRDQGQRTILSNYVAVKAIAIIMPHLPFSTSPSPSSSPSTSPSPPSIVLHPASGILDRCKQGCASNLDADKTSKRELYKSNEDQCAAYRKRYAQYLAATFNMSLEAAMAEADVQLAPRRCSGVSEAETLRDGW